MSSPMMMPKRRPTPTVVPAPAPAPQPEPSRGFGFGGSDQTHTEAQAENLAAVEARAAELEIERVRFYEALKATQAREVDDLLPHQPARRPSRWSRLCGKLRAVWGDSFTLREDMVSFRVDEYQFGGRR